jgi:agmatinase
VERDISFGNSPACLDLGDVEVSAGNPKASFDALRSAINILNEKTIFPLCLGGDHAITAPILEALSNKSDITVVHLDAHMDYWDADANSIFDHSCCMWLAARMSHVKRIIQLGIRGLNHSRSMVQSARANKIEVYSAREIHDNRARLFGNLNISGNVYLTVDVDFFDPSIAPGTGTREPGGCTYNDFSALLDVLRKSGTTIIGADVVEVNPLIDNIGITSVLASRLVMDIIALVSSEST